MNKRYKKILNYSIALLVLFAILVALPWHWKTRTGMSQVDYDKALTKAKEAMLLAENPVQRQAAVRKIEFLKDYKNTGKIEELRDMRWALEYMRYLIIVALLGLCFIIGRLVLEELRRLERADDKDPGSSANQV